MRVVLFLLFPLFLFGQYKVTNSKVVGWAMIAAGGFVDGFVEGYEFDGRTYFERKFGVSPTSRFGSRSWERRYTHPNVWNQNMGVFDFYHIADDGRKVFYIGGGIVIGLNLRKQKRTYNLYDILATLAISSISKSAGMRLVRHK
jgi:hypothetical protein